jgi:phospholipase D1/2
MRRPGKNRQWPKLVLAALLIAALAAAWRFTPLAELITPAHVSAWARALRGAKWAPIALVLAYTPAEFVMFPRALLTMLGAIALGPWVGLACAMTGIFGASAAAYGVGRMLAPGSVERLAGERLERVSRVLRRHGFVAVLAVRIVPIAPSVLVGIIAGAIRIRLWQYLLGTLLGMTPGVLATTFFGHQISTALEDPSKINYRLIGLVLLLMGGLMYAVRRWFRLQDQAGAPDAVPAQDATAGGRKALQSARGN